MMYQEKPWYSSPRFLGPPVPINSGGDVQCLSLQCEHNGGCAPIGMTNSIPPKYIYPPDCARHAYDPLPPNQGHPYGDDMVTPGGPPPVTGQNPDASTPAPFNLGDVFSGMSTTTLLMLGAAAYFLFFKKGR